MSDEVTIDLFAEDRAHEEFLKAVIHRLAREEKKRVRIRFRSATGSGGEGRTVFMPFLFEGSWRLAESVEPQLLELCRGRLAGGDLPAALVVVFAQVSFHVFSPDRLPAEIIPQDELAAGRFQGLEPLFGREVVFSLQSGLAIEKLVDVPDPFPALEQSRFVHLHAGYGMKEVHKGFDAVKAMDVKAMALAQGVKKGKPILRVFGETARVVTAFR